MTKEELLISWEQEIKSKGVNVMNSVLENFEKLVTLCADRAPAMMGLRSGLATLVKQKNPKAITTQCIIASWPAIS
ncbi:hypothetical protein GWI33_007741 [Rhynchophorus ferrugineus]|uniref:Uncharacterized protein n=1 Tax=Rhynchophorus ferrugineus TaxID=354439 RepID=A0A834J2B3_RHYFE|nr:hypothetical protein GWI33_007741 [Rhynchophorus ferrugineus]